MLKPSDPLPHYLRSFRKRAGLTQQELASLLGCESDSKVSRYEFFLRKPSLRTAFAYEVIFDTPARQLFAGIFEEVETITRRRARTLLKQLEQRRAGRTALIKRESVLRICGKSKPGGHA